MDESQVIDDILNQLYGYDAIFNGQDKKLIQEKKREKTEKEEEIFNQINLMCEIVEKELRHEMGESFFEIKKGVRAFVIDSIQKEVKNGNKVIGADGKISLKKFSTTLLTQKDEIIKTLSTEHTSETINDLGIIGDNEPVISISEYLKKFELDISEEDEKCIEEAFNATKNIVDEYIILIKSGKKPQEAVSILLKGHSPEEIAVLSEQIDVVRNILNMENDKPKSSEGIEEPSEQTAPNADGKIEEESETTKTPEKSNALNPDNLRSTKRTASYKRDDEIRAFFNAGSLDFGNKDIDQLDSILNEIKTQIIIFSAENTVGSNDVIPTKEGTIVIQEKKAANVGYEDDPVIATIIDASLSKKEMLNEKKYNKDILPKQNKGLAELNKLKNINEKVKAHQRKFASTSYEEINQDDVLSTEKKGSKNNNIPGNNTGIPKEESDQDPKFKLMSDSDYAKIGNICAVDLNIDSEFPFKKQVLYSKKEEASKTVQNPQTQDSKEKSCIGSTEVNYLIARRALESEIRKMTENLTEMGRTGAIVENGRDTITQESKESQTPDSGPGEPEDEVK